MKNGILSVTLLVLTVFLNLTGAAFSANPPVREFSASRYTDLGSDMVFAELGTLSVDTGFTVTTSFEAARTDLALEQSTLNAISGEFMVRKDQVDFLRQIDPTVLSLFEFSSKSYSAGNFLLYITKVAGTGSTGTPSVSVKSSRLTLSESMSQKAKLTVSLSKNATKDTVIHFKFAGTAVLGKDFKSSASKSVTIPKGSRTAVVTLTAVTDKMTEPIETIVFKVTTGTGYKIGKPAGVTLSIKK